jgi:hypothetical protein
MNIERCMRRAASCAVAGIFLALSASAQISPVGQTIEVAVWNAGSVGGSLDPLGSPVTAPGAQAFFVFDGEWHPIFGTTLEVKGESFGTVIPGGTAACNPTSDPSVYGDCEYIELSVRDTVGLGIEYSVLAPTEQSAVVFSGLGGVGLTRTAVLPGGTSAYYNYFSDDLVPVAIPAGSLLDAYKAPDLLSRPEVGEIIQTIDAGETAPMSIELSTANLGGVPLASYTSVFGVPAGWDGVTVGVVIERLVPTPPPATVPGLGIPGLGLLALLTTAIGAAARPSVSRQPGSKTA